MNLSVIVPVYNEQENLHPLFESLSLVLNELTATWEIIFVDDGSQDGSAASVESLRRQDSRVKLISLSRNFGHQLALTAGMDYAGGEAVILMDADLQHPPALIKELIRLWREGNEIVYTIRQPDPDQPWLKRQTALLFYKVFRCLTGLDLPMHTADFRLLDKKVVAAFKEIRERSRFLRGLTQWVGFRSAGLAYQPQPRHSGVSKYTFSQMIHLATDGIVSFSTIPLYAAIYLGFGLATLGFLYSVYVLYARFVTHQVIPGWTSLIMLLSIIGGIQLILLGIAGIYIGKIYEEVKQRPLYLLRYSLGFER
jgi:glycosyltransferase involved in cell wall biosynthesis